MHKCSLELHDNVVDLTRESSRKRISYMKYIFKLRPKQLGTLINFESITQRNAPDH